MNRRNANPFRRTAIVSAIAAVSTVVAMVVPGLASAQEEFETGSAKATARLVQVGPSAARLSLSSSAGLVLSDYIGHRARSESRVFDFAGLQGTMEDSVPQEFRTKQEADDEGFDNPFTPWDERNGTGVFQLFPTLRTEAGLPGADTGKRWEAQPGVVQDVSATDDPLARAAFRLQAFHQPGLIEVTGGQARTFAGIYDFGDGETEEFARVAGGTVDIGKISLLDGLVVLRDVRWEVAQITDENDDDDPEAIGRFVVGRFQIRGQEAQEIDGGELTPLFDAANQVLGPAGIQIRPPERTNSSGVVNLTPLSIVVASDLGQPIIEPLQEQLVGPAGEAFIAGCQGDEGEEGEEEPPEEESDAGGAGAPTGLLGRVDPGPVLGHHGTQHEPFDEFNSDGPGGTREDVEPREVRRVGSSPCGIPFLVADLAMAPFSGAGSLDIDIGGIFATTEGQVFENPFAGGFEFGGDDEQSPTFAAGNDAPEAPPAVVAGAGQTTPSTPPETTTPPDSTVPPSGGELAAPTDVNLRTSPASAVWSIGLLGLGAALAMAATDYRRLKLRRRSVTPIS